jgi:hypothetical protein
MDTDLVADRAQPTIDPKPTMAGRIAGPGRDRGGGDVPTAGRRASCSRRASKERSSSEEARGRAAESRGSAQSQYKRKRQSDPGPRRSHIIVHHGGLCWRWWTDWTRVFGWSSREWHRQRVAARERQGHDMKRSLNSTSDNENAYESRLRYPNSDIALRSRGSLHLSKLINPATPMAGSSRTSCGDLLLAETWKGMSPGPAANEFGQCVRRDTATPVYRRFFSTIRRPASLALGFCTCS